ncbi:zinc ribbon domain-containing protein [Aquihabitans sp. McL0605]|uniref:zinc ribbon domain-containing protein n=1 Tax=Aquihabitans sp. McL0605 TaxID=3415671 RepID=UPI003CEC07CA
MTDNPALLALLDVQAHDTKLDQLHHLHESLPAREQRDGAANALADTERSLAAESVTRDDLARQQKRVDDEVELLKEKRAGYDTKLYSGTVTSPGELQDLQKEIDALSRRISLLEDNEIEIMEQVEPVEARLVELEATVEQRRAVLADAELRLTASEAEVLADIDAEVALRASSLEPVPAELLAEYQALRGGRGGIGVARLVGAQCGGCHLTLSAMEAARMRKLPAGEVAHCEECGRILVP